MSKPSIAHVMTEFLAFSELLDDAYWEASDISTKDFIYDINSMFLQEIGELNKLSIQDHHYPYEFITEGIRRIASKVEEFDQNIAEFIPRTKTLIDMRDILSNILAILEAQSDL